MRLFIAVDLDEGIRRALGRLTRDLAARIEAGGARVRIKWVRPEVLHFTLRFIGEVDDGNVARIRTVVEPALDGPPFEVQVTGLGVFPASGVPRVIWAGAGRGAADLNRLHDQVEARLCETGLERDRRAFTAHLTLARVGQANNRSYGTLRGIVADTNVDAGLFRVDHVTLYESRLCPEGPAYTALTRTAFKN